MPSFGDIMDAVDLLQINAVEIDKDKCVRAANRNSKCDKCASACIVQAIKLSRGDIEIDFAECVNCGCCVPVCPMDALKMVEPSSASVLKRAEDSASSQVGMAVFACSRMASKNIGDRDKYAEVPCLGHISESQLLELVAQGIDDIVLVDGCCETCKLGASSERVDMVVKTAARFLDACRSDAIITRQSELPEECLSEGVNARGEGRRGLLRQTTSYMRAVAGNVAKKTIEDKLQQQGSGNGNVLSERLKRGKGAGILHFEPETNYNLIESMEKIISSGSETSISEPDADSEGESMGKMSTRHFGNVFIDVESCSGCGMCVLFCPTEAIKYDDFEETENEESRYCDFQAVDCTQCLLCRDVCLRECLEVSSVVELDELLDFEPRLIEIAKPKKVQGLAGLARFNMT